MDFDHVVGDYAPVNQRKGRRMVYRSIARNSNLVRANTSNVVSIMIARLHWIELIAIIIIKSLHLLTRT